MNYNEVDLTRGADEFNAKINNAKGVINSAKLLFSDGEIDISSYEKELETIISSAANDKGLDNNKKFSKLSYQNMQMDYVGLLVV